MHKEKPLNLKVETDERSGFCFGVIKAIEKAEELLDKGETVYCVGEIVHNDEEVDRLKKKGLKTIDQKQLKELKNATVLFRAHGEPISSYRTARKNNNQVFDATCPIVLKLQRDIKKAYDNDEQVFIFGKPTHPEVIGLSAQTNDEAIIFESPEELKDIDIPESLTLFSQTTKSLDEFYRAVEFLREKGIDVNVKDTICRQVANREHELKTFSKQNDKIVFVAGKNSSNGKVLYNICRKYNSSSYFISSPKELREVWFKANDTVGVCGATSTPQWLLEQVKEKLESL
jgi:4-hydroxy-3-methylbut-2-enyl diphosphate reductase